jgi:hypothetical protein
LSIVFDLIVEEKLFEILFKKYKNEKFSPFQNEILIDSYCPIDEKYMIKVGFITEIILGIEKYLTEKLKLKNMEFDVIEKLSKCVLRINIKEDFRYVDLWNIYYEESTLEKNENSRLFYVDFLTLKPLQCKIIFI